MYTGGLNNGILKPDYCKPVSAIVYYAIKLSAVLLGYDIKFGAHQFSYKLFALNIIKSYIFRLEP